jgi:hypothetical protein
MPTFAAAARFQCQCASSNIDRHGWIASDSSSANLRTMEQEYARSLESGKPRDLDDSAALLEQMQS